MKSLLIIAVLMLAGCGGAERDARRLKREDDRDKRIAEQAKQDSIRRVDRPWEVEPDQYRRNGSCAEYRQ